MRNLLGRRRTLCAATKANDNPEYASWNKLTDRLVGSASIPFSILVLPQVFQNFVNMSNGNPQALSIISWEGYLSALLGNTLMCSHFADRGEASAVNVQLVGIANNMLVLAQMAFASFMPVPIFAAVAAVVGTAVAISIARAQGALKADSDSSGSLGPWRLWQLFSGVFGLAVVPQVLYNVLYPGNPTPAPGLTALAVAAVYFGVIARGPGQAKLVAGLPGWASTLLFALSPLPQLVRNFIDACSLEGLSVGTMLLALAGNALMVPRALLVRDVVWLAGTVWACVAGWGQLLSMFMRESPTTGLRFVSPPIFYAVSAVMAAYFVYVLAKDARVRTHSSNSTDKGGPSPAPSAAG